MFLVLAQTVALVVNSVLILSRDWVKHQSILEKVPYFTYKILKLLLFFSFYYRFLIYPFIGFSFRPLIAKVLMSMNTISRIWKVIQFYCAYLLLEISEGRFMYATPLQYLINKLIMFIVEVWMKMRQKIYLN